MLRCTQAVLIRTGRMPYNHAKIAGQGWGKFGTPVQNKFIDARSCAKQCITQPVGTPASNRNANQFIHRRN